MNLCTPLPFLLSIILATGCTTTQKSDLDDYDSCLDVGASLAMDEDSPYGFAPQDVLDFLSTGFSADLLWQDSSGTTINMAFAEGDGNAQYYQFEQNPETQVVCDQEEGVVVRLDVAWSTVDGQLDYHEVTAVFASAADDVMMIFNLSDDQLTAPNDCAIGEGAEVETTGVFNGSGTQGEIVCEGGSSDSTTIASWPVL